MEFKRLQYFVAVAEELHFGRAAARLNMAQPPLSRQVAQLEKDIGVLLFDRSRSQIRLTQAGEVLLERSREVLNRLESAYREAALVGKVCSGRLRIAFVGSATHGVLPNLIKSYRSHYPEVELILSAMNNAEQKRGLIQREIDIGVARPSLYDEEFRSALLHEEPLILAVPDNSSLNSQDVIVLKELRNEIFILYPSDRDRVSPTMCCRFVSTRDSDRSRRFSRRTIKPRSAWSRSASASRSCRNRYRNRNVPGCCSGTIKASILARRFRSTPNRQPLAACHEFF